jgi:ubiquinone/menaquinone biosynthesis C-methylase UbiE
LIRSIQNQESSTPSSTPSRSLGHGLKLLDIGCGTGSSSFLLAEAFPLAQITCLDLSPPYLAHARAQLQQFDHLNFVQCDAAALPFLDHHFDGICSTFLFHELPLEVRIKILSESQRVLKPGGFWGMVDSIQKKDQPDFEWGLKRFPLDFHEPFYPNYSAHPMEDLLSQAGLVDLQTEIGFLSKVVWGRKNDQ